MAGARDGGRGTGHRGWALLRLLGHHQFRLLWTGMTVSLVGDGVFLVALAWQVYALSNVPTALSAVMLAMSVPHVLLLLVGGVVSDRFDRRRVMLAADLVRGAALLALAVLSLSGGMAVWSVAALAVLYGAGTAFFGPAFDAIVPEIVPTDLLVEANSLDQFVRPTALRLAGPALGGAVVAAVGPGWAFALDAATFAVSVWVLLLMVSGGRSDGTVGGPDDRGSPAARPSARCWKGSGSSAGTSGCGGRSSAPPSPTCCSWGLPRCCSRSWSRTTWAAAPATSASSTPWAGSARSPPRP
jgi:MFS family permease